MSLFQYETMATQIRDYLQSNMQSALNAVGNIRDDGKAPLQEPYFYFLFEDANPAQLPACYVLVDSFEYRLAEKRANHINALGRMRVGLIMEDYRLEELQIGIYRHATAMHKLLNQLQLEYTHGMAGVVVKNIVKVTSTSFSDVFKNEADNEDSSKFRKEFVHNLEVEHYEAISSTL